IAGALPGFPEGASFEECFERERQLPGVGGQAGLTRLLDRGDEARVFSGEPCERAVLQRYMLELGGRRLRTLEEGAAAICGPPAPTRRATEQLIRREDA